MEKIDALEVKMLLWFTLAAVVSGWYVIPAALIGLGYSFAFAYRLFKADIQEQPKEKCIMRVEGPI